MAVAACGICCDVCGLCVKGVCATCVAGTDEGATKKLDAQMQALKMHCPILSCAVERKVAYCLRDCRDFPCAIFESGFGPQPFPYSAGFLAMFKARLGRK